MDEKFLNEHRIIVQMILILFEGSIRYEDLSEIISKTNYHNIKSKTAFSTFCSKFKKGNIFNELRDKDGKKRYRINKPAIAYLKKVDSKKVSSVSVKSVTLVRSNFKVRYFIEQYIDKNPNLPLPEIIHKACNQTGNLFNPKDERAIERIINKIGLNILSKDTIDFFKDEIKRRDSIKENQLKNLQLGPTKRQEIAELKAKGIDVGEEHNGKPEEKEIEKEEKKAKNKKIKKTLSRLKSNDVFLSDILIEDVSIPNSYFCSIDHKDFYVKFKNLNTKKITLKYVHFCSSVDTKTSKIIDLYELTKDYSNSIKTRDVIKDALVYIRTTQMDLIKNISESQLPQKIENLKFKADHFAQIEVEFDVIFLNETNFKRVIKQLIKNEKLKSELADLSYEPRTTYKINFRHYNIYPMNEQTLSE